MWRSKLELDETVRSLPCIGVEPPRNHQVLINFFVLLVRIRALRWWHLQLVMSCADQFALFACWLVRMSLSGENFNAITIAPLWNFRLGKKAFFANFSNGLISNARVIRTTLRMEEQNQRRYTERRREQTIYSAEIHHFMSAVKTKIRMKTSDRHQIDQKNGGKWKKKNVCAQ